MACSCGAGFYGNGLVCNACKACSGNAAKSGQACSLGSTANTLVCTCNAGYYGDGTECSSCTGNGGVSSCACPAGYYGYGTTCSPCKTCDRNAMQAGACTAGSGSDMVQCTCNAGYYGAGTLCTPCQTCDSHAVTPGTCPAGTLSLFSCSCSAGFFGNGETCTSCLAGTFVSQAGTHCLNRLMSLFIYNPRGKVSQCSDKNVLDSCVVL